MTADPQQIQLLIGGAVGLLGAMSAGLYQVRISQNGSGAHARTLPGCLMIVAGWLGLTGLIMGAASFLLTGNLRLAVVPGLGVIAGFLAGSAFTFFLWLRFFSGRGRRGER